MQSSYICKGCGDIKIKNQPGPAWGEFKCCCNMYHLLLDSNEGREIVKRFISLKGANYEWCRLAGLTIPVGAPVNSARKHNRYFKPCPYNEVDVYRVLEMFGVTDQALGHAIKKLLCAGERGVKDQRQDVQEAVDTLTRRLEMWREDEGK